MSEDICLPSTQGEFFAHKGPKVVNSIQRIASFHLRSANFFIREEAKKYVWGALIWKLRESYRRFGLGKSVTIKAKVDPEKNRAAVSGIPKAESIRFIEFVPEPAASEDAIRLTGILRLLDASGRKLASTKVPVPLRLFTQAEQKNFSLELYSKLIDLIYEIKEDTSSTIIPTRQPEPPRGFLSPAEVNQAAPPPQKLSSHAMSQAVFEVLQKTSKWPVRLAPRDYSGFPPNILVDTPEKTLRAYAGITNDQGAVFWSISSDAETSDRITEEGHKMGPTAENFARMATAVAKDILAAVPKILGGIEAKKRKKLEYENSREGILEQIEDYLRGLRYGPAGRARSIQVYDEGATVTFDVDPVERTRLDHYGNDGDGWDDEGWEEDYTSPVLEAIEPSLKERFGKFYIDAEVDEKGGVEITFGGLPPKR